MKITSEELKLKLLFNPRKQGADPVAYTAGLHSAVLVLISTAESFEQLLQVSGAGVTFREQAALLREQADLILRMVPVDHAPALLRPKAI